MQDKRDFLFRFVPQNIRHELYIDDEAFYSTTDQVTARKICEELTKFVPREATVVDATACIGGMTYTLTNYFRKVIAVEIDDVRFKYLQTNMQLLSVSDVVECVKGDALDVCQKLQATAVILDPPWGGPDYKNAPSVSLCLSGRDLGDVCVFLYHTNPQLKILALKVPVNFDESSFKARIEPMYKIIQKTKLRKMYLIIVARDS